MRTNGTSSGGGLIARLRSKILTMEPLRDALLLASTVLLVVLVVVPLARLLINSFATDGEAAGGSLSNYVKVLSDPASYWLLWNSVIYATASSIIAITIGASLAYLLQRTNVRGKAFFGFLALAPAFMPPVLIAMSWVLLLDERIGVVNRWLAPVFGPGLFDIYSFWGMVWVGGLLDVPLAFLWLWPAFAALDPALEEAAAMSGARPVRVLGTVTMPLVRPALLAAFLVSFVMSIEDVTVPILIGLQADVRVFATEIYLTQTQIPPDGPLASAQSVLLLVVTIALMFWYRHFNRRAERFSVVRGKGYRPAGIVLGRWRPAAHLYLVLFTVLTVGLPLFVLVWTSLSPFVQAPSFRGLSRLSLNWYAIVLNDSTAIRGILNSLAAGVIAAIVVLALALVIGWAVLRSRQRIWALLDVLSFLPLALPGVVIGLALIAMWIPSTLPVYGTLLIIIIAYVTKFLPYGVRLIYAGMGQLHKELEEAAAISGASWLRILRTIYFPLLLPTMAAGLLYTVMRGFRELPASLILLAHGNETYSVVAYEFWSAGEPGKTAAYGVVVILVMTVLLISVRRLFGRLGM